MTHLRIEQGGTTEYVTSTLIHKLYEYAKEIKDYEEDPLNNVTTSLVSLKGNLSVPKAYGDEIDWLEAKFPDLHITATGGKYIRFEDSNVESILAQYWGDGTGITEALVLSVQHFNGKFANNTSILTFDEFYKFPNITKINVNNRFNSCTNLKSIDLRNITKISGENGYQRWDFEDCSNLESVGDTSNCTYFGCMAFCNCSKLSSVDLSSAVYIGDSAFFNCTSLSILALPQSITTIRSTAFRRILQMPSSINLPNLEKIAGAAFSNCSSIVNIENLGKITTFGTGTNGYNRCPIDECSNLETIILPETVTSIGFGVGNGSSKMRWIKILSAQVPTLLTYDSFNASWTNPSMDPVNGTYDGKTYPIYVRDDLLTQYQSATNWQYISFRLKPLSQFATDFPND